MHPRARTQRPIRWPIRVHRAALATGEAGSEAPTRRRTRAPPSCSTQAEPAVRSLTETGRFKTRPSIGLVQDRLCASVWMPCRCEDWWSPASIRSELAARSLGLCSAQPTAHLVRRRGLGARLHASTRRSHDQSCSSSTPSPLQPTSTAISGARTSKRSHKSTRPAADHLQPMWNRSLRTTWAGAGQLPVEFAQTFSLHLGDMSHARRVNGDENYNNDPISTKAAQ